jgi:hypothetical protein
MKILESTGILPRTSVTRDYRRRHNPERRAQRLAAITPVLLAYHKTNGDLPRIRTAEKLTGYSNRVLLDALSTESWNDGMARFAMTYNLRTERYAESLPFVAVPKTSRPMADAAAA